MSKIKLSVVIPIYNAKRYLRRCINSLVKQIEDNDSVEVILVDDGSTDGSQDICKEYTDKYRYINVIHQKNSGEGAARNAGIRVANGKWLSFVDADDFVDDNFIKYIFNSFDDKSNVIMFKMIEERNVNKKSIVNDTEKIVYYHKKSMDMIIKKCLLAKQLDNYKSNIRSACSRIFRTEWIMEKNIFFDEGVRIGTDFLFMLRVYSSAYEIKCVDSTIYHYCINSDSIINKYKPHYESISDESGYAFEVWLQDYPEYKPYYAFAALNDIVHFIKSDFFHKDNTDSEIKNKKRFIKLIKKGKFPVYYALAEKNKLLSNYPLKKRVVIYLAIHGQYTLCKIIARLRYG